jgi:hypothetical protein
MCVSIAMPTLGEIRYIADPPHDLGSIADVGTYLENYRICSPI